MTWQWLDDDLPMTCRWLDDDMMMTWQWLDNDLTMTCQWHDNDLPINLLVTDVILWIYKVADVIWGHFDDDKI